VWAKHWYADVARSTGFEPWRAREGALPARLERVHAECLGAYLELWERRLTA
jgi:hypothetical protein